MLQNPDVYRIIANASNVRKGDNPSYTATDFLLIYPQFDGNVPQVVIDAWIKIADASIRKTRWFDYWELGMGLYIAHFLTLHLQSSSVAGDATKKIINSGLSKGVQASKSAGDLSVSYDFSSVTNETTGWGTFSQTTFGQQFVQFAKLVGRGGMTIW